MNKLLFSVCIALAIFGCSGDMNDLPGLGGERKCGSTLYDATKSNLRCQDDVVEKKCGITWYDVASKTLICYNEVVLTRCGARENSQEYYENQDYYENPQKYFNASTQFCSGDVIYSKCGGEEYEPSTQYCSGTAAKTFGSVSQGDQAYKTVAIGVQTWMAENLNYNPGTGNSACYNNQASNCTTYGRLYDWATAMALSPNCNSNSCDIAAVSGIRGICPEGWHIPSNADWDGLFRYVDGTSGTESPYNSSTAGKVLKAASGWSSYYSGNNNGTNAYGFSALPGGGGNYASSFSELGYVGAWWSASEDGSGQSFYRYMGYTNYGGGNDIANYEEGMKNYLFSVRCIQDKCNGLEYNPATHFCHADGQTYSCGNKPIYPAAQFCSGGEAYDKCNGQEYNPSAQRCYNSIVQTKCGEAGNYYDPATQFCSGGVPYNKCNGQEYNPSTYFCSGGALQNTCNGLSYNLSSQFCSGGTVYNKCDGSVYEPSEKFCSWNDNSGRFLLYDKCGGLEYYPSLQFCSEGVVYYKCGGNDYDPSTQFCSNGSTVKTYDGIISYGGQTYKIVIIGEQTWMAENLNYAVAGSKCYDNDPANCVKYGRLYDWATAMGFISSCNESSCADQINTPHQGICPDNWHIPSEEDWYALMTAVGGVNTSGIKLKATSGWYSCGPYGSGNNSLCEDAYGFSALPGGYGDSDGNFSRVGEAGLLWSTVEGEYCSNSTCAYPGGIYHSNENTLWGNDYKSNLFSVRCIQDP